MTVNCFVIIPSKYDSFILGSGYGSSFKRIVYTESGLTRLVQGSTYSGIILSVVIGFLLICLRSKLIKEKRVIKKRNRKECGTQCFAIAYQGTEAKRAGVHGSSFSRSRCK